MESAHRLLEQALPSLFPFSLPPPPPPPLFAPATQAKPAELQDIKIQKVGTVTKLSKPIKITAQNIKKKIYTTQKIQKIEGKDGQL